MNSPDLQPVPRSVIECRAVKTARYNARAYADPNIGCFYWSQYLQWLDEELEEALDREIGKGQ